MKKSLKKNNNGCSDICYDVYNDRTCLRKKRHLKFLSRKMQLFILLKLWKIADATIRMNVLPTLEKEKVAVRSSNTKVATVKIKDNAIWATPKKAGTTTITVKTGQETYKCTFTVYKYVKSCFFCNGGEDHN